MRTRVNKICMAKRCSSAAAQALNDILSSSESSNEDSESIYSDESNSELSEASQDCEIVEFQQNCDESESHNEERCLQNIPSTSAVSLSNVLKAPRRSDLTRKR